MPIKKQTKTKPKQQQKTPNDTLHLVVTIKDKLIMELYTNIRNITTI